MSISYDAICAFFYREARLLDDREWDEWLTCYAPDVTYWMPAWDDDDRITEDPQSQISLIYYPNRDGLEDRVFRIKTERSGASTPEPRTSHNVTNVEVLAHRGDEVDVRYNFHTLNHRYKVTDHFFGTMFATLRKDDDALLIARKKIVLKNDYIRQVIDVYHV
ncbi:benzoate 1,2-dioxygenase small subunit [Rhizobium leguminosarum]|jgi:benzoate/toluate 1,2-dioxygenase beta subunit|uniref:Benzoate 1,2-dioxygenase subunit beta n=3 Tax=Rhizobium TaxID=379 RepID=A0A1B8R288_RHILT|nr:MULTISPECIES: benzoate 1,2-dioxygenase small subunit [Rhizobium]MDH6659760.1 benzoate/toluate 1,2-dioxygenase beta subunit [Rhizobium sophorae]AOO94428.1 benzoate 1,2-dioxygenase subunit beta [Rhizobium leguminosarum bv. trifolii]ASS54147.1 benzoate 1,2-dioxygenase small subunit [Rhizobium leguminosarum bv. viciae]AVC48580.1 benzoate 1,2-dioxygenase, small subunit [Rhizobium leguminosarum bv. viciae]MBA8835529.1 benzoate/toluate 1,2-dioxygenase beta subunit [Rhizobium leguminosarum]